MQVTQAVPRVKLRRGGRGRVRTKQLLEAYLMLAPFLAIFVVFTIWPIARSLYLSFTDFSGLGEPELIGLANFRELLSDARFYRALGNTAVYTL